MPFLIENHDEAYHLWRRMGLRNQSLVHVDAHHDMWWLDDEQDLTIGNYVCQAIKAGIVSEVVWVVPSASWANRSSRRILRQHLGKLAKAYGTSKARVKECPRRLSTMLGRTPMVVCALETIPRLAGPVLLDVDTDFMTLPRVSIGRDGVPGERPWIWPDALAAALLSYPWRPEVVTIAYSVDGGYTPIGWKWLGDALANALGSPDPAAARKKGFAALRKALGTPVATSTAKKTFLNAAAKQLPSLSAPQFHLALMHLRERNLVEARRYFERAARIDPAHRGPFGSRGLAGLNDGRAAEASREFNWLSALDPGNPFVELGLGRIAIRRRRWNAAAKRLNRAISASPKLVDAHRHLGDVFVRLRRPEQAAAAYARSLKLALEGERSLESLVTTNTPGRAARQEHHAYLHAALARLDARAGRISAAIAGFRMAIAAGDRRISVSRELARLTALGVKTPAYKQKKAAPAKR